MEKVNVSTQAELDKALAEGNIPVIVSNAHFEIREGSPVIEIGGSSSPSMVAWGSSSPRMVARESSSPRMEAWGSSSPRMVAWGSSSPSMEAWESSSPSMEAWESSSPRMEAWGSSSPRMVARESSSVTGTVGKHTLVGVLKHDRATVDLPGAVILKTPESVKTVEEWIDYYDCAGSEEGAMEVYKRVGDDLASERGVVYAIGTEVACDDWNDRAECGGGLHFSPSAGATRRYSSGSRVLLCEVQAADVVLLGDKLKAPACKVIAEVDEDGERLALEADAA